LLENRYCTSKNKKRKEKKRGPFTHSIMQFLIIVVVQVGAVKI
jgi:hypothetical protein